MEFIGQVFWPWYAKAPWSNQLRIWNSVAAWLHLIQFLAVLIAYEVKLKNIDPDLVFVSGTMRLTYPSFMIHVTDGSEADTTCQKALDVIHSPAAYSALSHVNGDITLFGVGNSVILNLTSTALVEYDASDYSVHTPGMIMVFFLLSWSFQLFNGWYIEHYGSTAPHMIQYLEYSISSSLTLLVMAVNVGVIDLVAVMTMFTLFFGMNLLGAVAEIMLFVVETHKLLSFRHAWLLPHFAAWALFLFAWLPLILEFNQIARCSTPTAPWFVYLAIVLESTCYFLFGLLQSVTLFCRWACLWQNGWKLGIMEKFDWISVADTCAIGLSLVAKTLLAWTLLGSVLSSV